jgi:molecular chaperone Hsp33
MESALISLGKSQLKELSEEPNTEMCCHFCNQKYNFTREDIINLIGECNG